MAIFIKSGGNFPVKLSKVIWKDNNVMQIDIRVSNKFKKCKVI